MTYALLNASDEKSKRQSLGAVVIVLWLKLIFLCLCLTTSLMLIIFAMCTDDLSAFLTRLASKHGYNKNQFAVIIEAGAIESRLFAYKFEKSIIDNELILRKEHFKEHAPGLNAFSNNPVEFAQSINFLVDDAKAFIPKEYWSSTPLVLKATADFNKLPQNKTENLLNAVRKLFATTKFSVDVNAVKILDDKEKNIFDWLGGNLVFKRLSRKVQLAALDLSDDTLQVTYMPKEPEQAFVSKKYRHALITPRRVFNLFSKSYARLGLMAARHAVFFTESYDDKNATVVKSSCVNPIISNRSWTYRNVEYKVNGIDRTASMLPMVFFDECHSVVMNKVFQLLKPKPFLAAQNSVLAFGHFFEIAAAVGLIDPFTGGQISVQAYHNSTRDVCEIPNDEQPFMCLDLMYISVLLHEGFGLGDHANILLHKQFGKHEISWALGCAFHMLTNDVRFK